MRQADAACPVKQVFDALNGFTVDLDSSEADRLKAVPSIRSLEADQPMLLTPPVEINPVNSSESKTSGTFTSSQASDLDREVRLEKVFVGDVIERSESDLGAQGGISTSALPVYSNGTASTGEVLPYGVKAVWGGTDISSKGNIGSGTYAFVIDSGVLDTTGDLLVNKAWSKSWVSGEGAFTDGNGHGTHVAGTIAALANGKGVVGVAPGAEVISLKVFNSSGGGASYSTIIDAVNYATNVINSNGLDKSKCVINMSLGGGFSSGLDSAVKAAANQGIKFAIAAGNSGSDADGYSPAAAGDHPNVYTVSAVDNKYQMAGFSNWDDPSGGDDVDFAAPGVSVRSYYKGGALADLSGTSMAAPHVAGLLLMGNVKTGDMVKANGGGYADPFALGTLPSGGTPTPPSQPNPTPPSPSPGYERALAPRFGSGSVSLNGGSLDFSIDNRIAGESLTIKRATSAKTGKGDVSIVGNDIFVGDGAKADKIGSIDKAKNGASGELKIVLSGGSGSVINGDFNQGTTGWNIYSQRLRLNGRSTVLGYATPNDYSLPYRSPGDNVPVYRGSYGGERYSSSVVRSDSRGGGNALQLWQRGGCQGYGVVHGSYATTNKSYFINKGGTISFEWKAQRDYDTYDVFSYLLNTDNGKTIELVNASGRRYYDSIGWQTVSKTINESGKYALVFLAAVMTPAEEPPMAHTHT